VSFARRRRRRRRQRRAFRFPPFPFLTIFLCRTRFMSCSRALSSVSPFYSSLAALSTHVPCVLWTCVDVIRPGLPISACSPCFMLYFLFFLLSSYPLPLHAQGATYFTAHIAFPHNSQYQQYNLDTPYTTQIHSIRYRTLIVSHPRLRSILRCMYVLLHIYIAH